MNTCSVCGNSCGGTCDVCREKPCQNCCKNPCIRWGFDGCFLRGRCADGTELDPLNLCNWLKSHESCTTFRLVTKTTMNDSYMEFLNECDESHKIYVCDFLSLASITCLGDVETTKEGAKSCDIMVFDPCCGSPCDKYPKGKWTNYHIPDAGDCVLEPDAEGYYHVLVKNDCGCIKECKIFVQSKVWEWSLRDSWPDDPDWPWSVGAREGENSEVIDLLLDKNCDMFGKADLEVTFQYSYGIQSIGTDGIQQYNFKSIVTPMNVATHTPGVTDILSKAIVVQGGNLLPFGSWEWQVSRTVIVPRGKKLYLNHIIEMRDINTNMMHTWYGEMNTPTHDCSRLHALHVFVRAVNGVQK